VLIFNLKKFTQLDDLEIENLLKDVPIVSYPNEFHKL